MVVLFLWQQQSSKLKIQIFGSFASACENPVFKKKFLNLTDIVLHYKHYFTTGITVISKCMRFLLCYGLLNFIITNLTFLELLLLNCHRGYTNLLSTWNLDIVIFVYVCVTSPQILCGQSIILSQQGVIF